MKILEYLLELWRKSKLSCSNYFSKILQQNSFVLFPLKGDLYALYHHSIKFKISKLRFSKVTKSLNFFFLIFGFFFILFWQKKLKKKWFQLKTSKLKYFELKIRKFWSDFLFNANDFNLSSNFLQIAWIKRFYFRSRVFITKLAEYNFILRC